MRDRRLGWDVDVPADLLYPSDLAATARVQLNLPVPERALAVGAHPDDIEFGCGGTLAKWAAAGCVVNHVVLTDGSKGSWDLEQDLDDLVSQRQDEQRAAARALGATGDVVFGGWIDGELASGARETERMAYWIRRLRPDVVLGPRPVAPLPDPP